MRGLTIKTAKFIFLSMLSFWLFVGCSTLSSFYKEAPTTFLGGKDMGPATFSPDGNELVFSLENESHRNIYKVRVDGIGLIALTAGESFDVDPVFSPKGDEVLFIKMLEGQGDLCVIKVNGSEERCLTSGPENDFSPVYGPDGNKIYFLRASVFRNYSPIAMPGWHNVDIYSINIDGTGLSQITSEKAYGMSSLTIDPKGDVLMVQGAGGRNDDSFYQIWMIPINDPTKKKTIQPDLTKYRKRWLFFGHEKIDYDEIRNPRFSPDGKHILFTWRFHGGLYLMDLQTNLTQKILGWESENGQIDYWSPRFSADGKRVVFITVKHLTSRETRRFFGRDEPTIWIINTDGTGLRSVEVK